MRAKGTLALISAFYLSCLSNFLFLSLNLLIHCLTIIPYHSSQSSRLQHSTNPKFCSFGCCSSFILFPTTKSFSIFHSRDFCQSFRITKTFIQWSNHSRRRFSNLSSSKPSSSLRGLVWKPNHLYR